MAYELTAAIEAVNAGEEVPEEIEIEGKPAFRLEFHRTDAWRGHYNAVAVEGSGWEKVEDGWMTGDYDDAPFEARESNVKAKLDALDAQGEKEGFEVAIVFAPTSNVFSTGYDVFKKEVAA